MGYIRITSFQEHTTDELSKTLESLEKKSKNHLRGVILDLRNNPGGLLDEAIRVSNLFLDSGTIVTTVSRNKEIDRKSVSTEGVKYHFPLVVLVNGGSASAAEIVAGALQDHKRAKLLGTQTFGKGSVQTIFDLGDGTGLKLTIAKYYTPNGRSIQAEGITPDVIVAAKPKKSSREKEDSWLREKDLKGHLEPENKNHKKASTPKRDVEEAGPETSVSKNTQEEDYQKIKALEYLHKLL